MIAGMEAQNRKESAPAGSGSVGRGVATVMLILGLLAAASAGLMAACSGGGADSPEDLFEEVRLLGAAGEWEATWFRLHPDQQNEFRVRVEESREFYRKNPGATDLTHQSNCSIEEYMSFEYPAIWGRGGQASEVFMTEARISRTEPAPDVPGDMLVHWISSTGDDHTMRARPGEDGDWLLMSLD